MGPFTIDQISPERRDIPQIVYHICDGKNDLIDICFCHVLAEAEPQRTMGDLVGSADCQQHMTGIKRAACTSGAGGSADTLVIQQKQERFTFDALKTEIHITGQPMFVIAVQFAIRNLIQSMDQPLPQDR